MVNQKKDFEKYILLLKFVIIPFLILVILIHEYQVIFLSVHYLFSLSLIKSKKNIIQITKIYSVLLIPTSITIASFFTQSPLTSFGLPTAAIIMSALLHSAFKSFVFE